MKTGVIDKMNSDMKDNIEKDKKLQKKKLK